MLNILSLKIIQANTLNNIDVKLDTSTILPHPYGITIHPLAKIGKNVIINQHVTIGNRKGLNPGAPTIEDDVHIFANAVILGNIIIGKGSVIGACALVLDDVPPYSVVYGIPAKVIRKVEKDELYSNR